MFERLHPACLARIVALAVMMNCLLSASADAAYTTQDSCRAGDGTYTGQVLNGTCSYQLCTINGATQVKITFNGRFAQEAYFQETPAVIFEETPVSDAGEVDIDQTAYTVFAPNGHLKVVGQFGECGISGTWQLTATRDGDFAGNFSISGSGPGEACDSGAPAPAAGGAGLCGAAGVSEFTVMLVGLTTMVSARSRNRKGANPIPR